VLGADFDDVLESARLGSRPALGAIYRDLFPGVLAYLRARRAIEPEDLASDVFVDVATGLLRFSGDEHEFRGWVFTIARRRAIDAGRRASRRATSPVPTEALADLPSSDDPSAEVIARLGAEEALELVDRLPSRQAEVVRLRVIAGLGVEETATVLGKRPGTVRVVQHRALRKLRRMIDHTPPADA
jgi:RNA polymerase sigma-70 factor (ECF subfamily)